MKKFEFPLDRVLDWRRTQARLEESKLERLRADLHAIESQLAEAARLRQESVRELITAKSVTGLELAALDDFRKASAVECVKLKESAEEAEKRVAAQLGVVAAKRRDVKLLENLRARRLDGWKLEFGQEIEREAGELFLANRGRRVPTGSATA